MIATMIATKLLAAQSTVNINVNIDADSATQHTGRQYDWATKMEREMWWGSSEGAAAAAAAAGHREDWLSVGKRSCSARIQAEPCAAMIVYGAAFSSR